MDATKNETFIYMDMYDYENDYPNSSRFGEESPQISKGFMAVRIVLCMLFFLGLLGNTTVLWILHRYIKMKTLTDICLLNLALSDLTLALSLILWAYNSQNLAVCKITTGVYQLGFYSGTLFVTLMSVDRYLAIVHAVATMQARTLGFGLYASIAIWVVSLAMATPQIFCYVKILLVLSKTRNSNKGRAVKLIFIIVCVFVVCWVPYNVVVFLQTLQLFEMFNTYKASTTISLAMTWSEVIALSHCCVNPVIYAFVGEKFRKPLGNLFSRYCYKSRGSVSQRDNSEKETSNTHLRSH
ncbi:C-C chemokine receptor type 4 isoform X2 [Hippocampus zosterae]|uniref:C-C chemokine receptor type 4 isoform X2 n=1 Tax=Hippocampus zosterae TaxID=109293 RepID=UPI00223D9825|nr:C-C chemokine receptor type 4 isoform X2 [Hippocampus zosterae]